MNRNKEGREGEKKEGNERWEEQGRRHRQKGDVRQILQGAQTRQKKHLNSEQPKCRALGDFRAFQRR